MSLQNNYVFTIDSQTKIKKSKFSNFSLVRFVSIVQVKVCNRDVILSEILTIVTRSCYLRFRTYTASEWRGRLTLFNATNYAESNFFLPTFKGRFIYTIYVRHVCTYVCIHVYTCGVRILPNIYAIKYYVGSARR